MFAYNIKLYGVDTTLKQTVSPSNQQTYSILSNTGLAVLTAVTSEM
jgi:hypothetical protein